jgi:trehalose 6-phosphate synthase/phosphatase
VRLLIVSNRLPVTTRVEAGQVRLDAASGGLATGLSSWHERSKGVWIGWPGNLSRLTPEQQSSLDRQLRERGLAPVHLSQDQVERYYEGFSNRVIWPMFHYQIDRVPLEATGWEAYRQANRIFAEAVAAAYRPGDAIWVHDYQLMLVPEMVRALIPEARIGFFLHIPFPSSEVFRILPWRSEVLRGLLAADLVGFHTFAYLRHFLTSLLHIEGIEAEVDRIRFKHRVVKVGVFPMGVDASAIDALARDPRVDAEVAAIREQAGDRRILLGVDRLDYTKGIPRRLVAVERLLRRHPELRDSVRYIQVAVPSRERVEAYESFRRQVEEAVGRINGACATVHSTPIHYLHRSVSREQLVALFRAADVMLVTPLRDGMNLVAKEFVASRADEDGVLVLSEFAGASAELGEAVVVNPYDIEAGAQAIRTARTMPAAERRTRMRGLRRRVMGQDVHHWVCRFTEQLDPATASLPSRGTIQGDAAALREALAGALQAERVTVLLDYDGTLVPMAPAPELAAPDENLLALLAALAGRGGTDVHLISGRLRETLEEWFGELPISLWAEHGLWQRPASSGWRMTAAVEPEWLARVYPILEHFTASTPGSLIERKTASVAWHYRMAEADFGARQAHELRMVLGDSLSNQPLEVIEGKKVIEVRARGVHKGLVARRILDGAALPRTVLAVGDDRTDEDLFDALPPPSITIAVGEAPSIARYRVSDYRAVRDLLQQFLTTPALDRR